MRVKIALAAAAALTTLGFAAPAMATPVFSTSNDTAAPPVTVAVTIDPTVSVWGASAALDLNGANPQNSAAVASTITYINNVDANISATVQGLTGGIGGTGIQFSIFPNTSDTGAALNAIVANQYGPANAITFNGTNGGTPQTLESSIGVHGTAHNENIVYAASLPGDLPAPGTTTLTVTYTITSNTP